MSQDFPFKSGPHQCFFKGSRSIFSTEGRAWQNGPSRQDHSQERSGAGLTTEHSMHNVLYFNGQPEKPQVFANLLRNANKHDLKSCFIDEDRFEIHKKFQPKILPK